MKQGSLVQVRFDKDELYLWDKSDMSTHVDSEVVYIWHCSMLGIILDFDEYVIPSHLMHPEERFYPVRVFVGDKIGWTYSDYLELLA